MPLLANINVGTAPNDGTGDTIRNAFTIVNENFQFIEAFFPNTDVANLSANITSTGTSTFNIINGATIGNSGAAFTGASINAATIGNAGTAFTGASISSATIGNSGAAFTGASINAATIGNAGAVFTGATVSAATIGNTGTTLTGILDATSSNQANIGSIGSSVTSNVTVVGNLNLLQTTVANVRAIQHAPITSSGGSLNIGMVVGNSQVVGFTMNANITLTLVGSIEAGIQKDLYFINNTASAKTANIFVWSNRTNKGSNSISVTSNTTTLVKIMSIDTTIGNVVAIITNT